jgi:hypothetical protein
MSGLEPPAMILSTNICVSCDAAALFEEKAVQKDQKLNILILVTKLLFHFFWSIIS